ncbi:uncharacterized protein LOC6040847 [Culex quinquefasciatus]|uniref:uncharacterized protein LOC6040847 n=1 Tax=Culex quinquefasciatus TaxID=7176 RepID=UPI0018E3022A|nr:uncharacterized protein LOC6040847 [Culex quinquefasciatus]
MILWGSGRRRRRRRLEVPPGGGGAFSGPLVQLTKWCTTLFIILESTAVGSDLSPSTTQSPTNVSSSISIASSSSTLTLTSSSGPLSTHPTDDHSSSPPPPPRFEALVQPLPRGHLGDGSRPTAATDDGDEDPLLLLGGFRFPAQLHPPAASSDSSSSVRTSPQGEEEDGHSGPLPLPVSAAQGAKSNLVNLGLSSSSGVSGISKIKSASSVSSGGDKKKVTEGESGGAVNRLDGEFRGPEIEGNFSKMYFETENLTTVSSQVGSIAVLPCVVRNIGEGVVSWIRRKDYHLLTIGVTTYSSDERFNIIRSEDSEEWPLQIKYVQLRDAGLYECQVSTHPPTSIFVQLDVVEAKAEIFGPSEKYLKPGSTLRLTCRVVKSNEPPLYIFWYHNNRMINYDVHRGVNVSTEADNRYSELVITHTNTLNSGNYSCVSNNAVAASTLVHILNGENPAAMQHGDHGNGVLVAVQYRLLLGTIVTYQVINRLLCARH